MSINDIAYRKALEKTKNIFGDQSEGFISQNPGATTTAKQLNTVLELLIQIHGKVTKLEEELGDLKQEVAKKANSPSTSGLDKQIEDLTQRISRIKPDSKPPTVRGKLKVVQDPWELYRKIK